MAIFWIKSYYYLSKDTKDIGITKCNNKDFWCNIKKFGVSIEFVNKY